MGFLLNSLADSLAQAQTNANTASQAAEHSRVQAQLDRDIADARRARDKKNMAALEEKLAHLSDAVEKGDTSGVIRQQRERIEALQKTVKEKDQILATKDDLIRQWIISQTAFKNLFKKYGKFPDGRPLDKVSDEEKAALLNKEISNVEKNGEGLASPEVRAIVMGK